VITTGIEAFKKKKKKEEEEEAKVITCTVPSVIVALTDEVPTLKKIETLGVN
jgi:hypothetical protein